MSSATTLNFSNSDVTLFPPTDTDAAGGGGGVGVSRLGEGDLVSADQYNLVLKIAAAIKMVICIGGIGCNILTIRVFLKMGLEDSVIIVFFNLAISDLNVLIATLGTAVSMVCQTLERDYHVVFKVPLLFINYTSISYGRVFTYATTYFITFLAIQRCLCVIRPLHFKGVFTRSRTVIVIAVLWVYCVVSGALILNQFGLRKETDSKTNTTAIVMITTPIYKWVRQYLGTLNGIALNLACQVIVLVCVFVLAYGLKKSVQFRQTAAKQPTTTKGQGQNQNSDGVVCNKDENSTNSKERQAIVQVAIVSTIFLMTAMPLLVISLSRLVFSELGPFRRYHYTYYTVLALRFGLEALNSASNFFVYITYNAKFRQLCFK